MLILSRKEGESVSIGEGICIKIVEINKGVIKLGIDAPDDVMILRDELKQAVKQANIKSNSKASMQLLSSIKEKLS